MKRALCCTAALLVLVAATRPARAQFPRSVERDAVPAPAAGPLRPDAVLPPEGPLCPGENGPESTQCDHLLVPRSEEKEQAGVGASSAPVNSTGAGASSAPTDSEDAKATVSEQSTGEEGSATASPDSPREVPDYNGVSDGPDVGEILLWPPRVVLFPLYVVSEYGLRRPIGFVVEHTVREQWVEQLADLFTFGPDRTSGIIPTALFDFGFRPSVGFFSFWNDALVDGHDLRLRAATGGLDWWQFDLTSRYNVTRLSRWEFRASSSIRPDNIFHGLGALAPSERHRYWMGRHDFRVGTTTGFGQTSSIETFAGIRVARFDPASGCCNSPSMQEGIDGGAFAEPPGLGGYEIARQAMRLRLDSRARRFPLKIDPTQDQLAPPGSGVRVELRGEAAQSLRFPTQEISSFWARYGATLGGYLALPGYQRTLGLELWTDFADPLTPGDIPFTEQVQLGGDRVLRGFLAGRLIDRSAVAARVRYDWPVWVLLDGVLEYGVGGVFAEHLENFSPALMRQSFAFGLETAMERDHSFQMLVAVGTDTFDNGGGFDTLRLVFGGNSGL